MNQFTVVIVFANDTSILINKIDAPEEATKAVFIYLP